MDLSGQAPLWLTTEVSTPRCTSILTRKLLRRGSFTSIQDVQDQVLAFIAYYNRTMAKPFKWTYQGKALMA